jgi:hypothetical protein
MSEAELELYREAWRRRQTSAQDAGNPRKLDQDDGGNEPCGIADLALTWETYFNRLQQEPDHRPSDTSLAERLKVIRAARSF